MDTVGQNDAKQTTDTANVEKLEDVKHDVNNGFPLCEQRVKTPEEQKEDRRFLLKIDLTILPLLATIYFLASMDRGDIGNAAVLGMSEDLNLTPKMLSNCSSLFYVGYIVFMLPGVLLMRKITPPRQLALALMLWGTFTSLISVAKSYPTVVGLRVLVGAFEAFVNAAPLYLSLWYRRDELATRGAIFFATSAVAGSFNGIIAYGIGKNLNGANGMAAWKWLFLIEGVISVGYGFVILWLLPPVPEKVQWGFSAREKEIAKNRTAEAYNVEDAKINPQHLILLFKDPKIYFFVLIYCCLSVSLATFGSFLPVIIKSFGYSTLDTQLMTIPVYACAGVSVILLGWLSDRLKSRGILLAGAFTSSAVGWLLLIISTSQRLSFAATFLIGIGTYPSVVLTQSWMNSNIIGYTRRGGSLAAINIFGQCFSILGAAVYHDPPHYYKGNSVSLGAMVLGIIASMTCRLYLHRKNIQKQRDQFTEEAQRTRSLGIEEVADKHPDFFYYL